ncbi:putative T6SS immunity periplasmic lipoprotein [Serratia rhizosphaerae]
MRKLFFILPLLLSGCFHLGDPRAKSYKASVVVVTNHICVLIQPKGDEKMVSLSIDEPGNNKSIFNKYYDGDGLAVAADKCIPTYNYPFRAGHTYTLSITLRSQDKKSKGIVPAARLYGASFTLTGKDDELVISSIN